MITDSFCLGTASKLRKDWMDTGIILTAGWSDQSKAEAHWKNDNGPCGFGADCLQGHFGTLGHLALNKELDKPKHIWIP